MDLLEYQGKQLLAAAGVPASSGTVARTVDEVVAAADAHGYPAVVKAQVRIGGRGKAGGVKVVADAAAAADAGRAILGLDIRGHVVDVVLVEPACDIAAEYYASFTFDRSARLHLGLLSAQGGVDIEEVAARDPEAVARVHVDPIDGLSDDAARDLVARAGLEGVAAEGVAALLPKLYAAYVAADADLVEINPLVLTGGGEVVALDAKVTLDDNAAFRHPEWAEWRASEELDPREQRAREKGLNYVGLDGTVGIIGNGAGLVMATLDVVSQAGGSAANFLDIGGGASAEVMAAALDVVASDDRVGAIFVNIFGGITRGDEVANGILQALSQTTTNSHEAGPPIVVRLDGTNAEEGRAILADHLSDALRSEPTMSEAARTAVALAAGEGGRFAVSVLVDENTRVLVQGLTGSQGRFHGLRNRAYGTQVVAGVTPGKGGSDVEGIPVFDTVAEAVEVTEADVSLVLVPARFAAAAVIESADAGIRLVVCITEGIPLHDEARVVSHLRHHAPGTRLLGPNCPGIITPGRCNIGIIPPEIGLGGGPVGVVSRSGTLTYQALYELTRQGIGQTTCIGIGGDPVPGTGFIDCLRLFEDDPETGAVILIGEIGGSDEEEAAAFIASEMSTPVIAYVAGVTAPPGRKMGHAGAIVSGSSGGAAAKIAALEAAGASVVRDPTELGRRTAELLARA